LLGANQITVSPIAETQLLAGEVDSRLLSALTSLAASLPIDIVNFQNVGPGAGADMPYRVLGTDGFGRSDYRRNLRRFFEVDRHYVALAALVSLAEDETIPTATVADAISRYAIDTDKPDPATV
jgi:pyruvate dehydrogenase complex dehydrogenase (E1) component